MNELREMFARRIWDIGAFRDKTKTPGRKGFRLNLHVLNPGAPSSPFYIELRRIQSDFMAKQAAVGLFEEMLMSGQAGQLPDLLGAIPEAIVPVVSCLSDRVRIPMITPRQPKDHGSGAAIDGIYQEGQRVTLFDDVITKGKSALRAAETVLSGKLRVTDVGVLIDREEGGPGHLRAKNLNLIAAMTVTDLLAYYRAEKLMSEEVYQDIQEYRATAAK